MSKDIINEKLLNLIIDEVKTGGIIDKKISFHSIPVVASFEYLYSTVPGFVRATAANQLITAHLKKDHPELCDYLFDKIPQVRYKDNYWTGLKIGSIDNEIINEAISDKNNYHKFVISIYSPRLAAVFKYFKRTIPKFSTSKYVAEIFEGYFSSEYPDLWGKFKSS